VTIPVFPNSATRGFYIFALTSLLIASVLAAAQEPSAQFDDLAARAAAAREQQNLPLAIQLYTQAEQLKPDWDEGWWYLGLLQYGSNQYADAIESFTHLLRLDPTAVPAMALRGLCEFQSADYDNSLRDLEQAAGHGALNQPDHEQILRYHLALLLTRSGRFPEALQQYRALAAKKSDIPDLKLGIGAAGLGIASFPSEIPDQDRALCQSAGEAAYALYTGNSEDANQMFANLFAAHPSTPNLHYFYGLLLFSSDPAFAIAQFQHELAINPANDNANAMLALTLVLAGRYAEALPFAERAYDKTPNQEIAQVVLGRALAETGDVQRGTELLKAVLASDPQSLEAHLGLASIYSQAGNREQAEQEREVCRELSK
jgi:predicted Zn-dependent protease